MGGFEHHRFAIWNASQHPYKHSLDDFAYSNPAFGGDVTTVQQALNYIVAVLYPQMQAAVDEVADLPAVGNTINDMRVVNDDGDGKAASYRWEQREGEASASWHKIYDVDWGADSILQAWEIKTQDVYVSRYGYDDRDEDGDVLTGDAAGQHIYGGASANTHLTLYANSGDGVGVATGFIQLGDHTRPLVDSTFDLGTTSYRWRKIWTDEITSGTLTLASGSITDASGSISFSNENLSTTGTLASGTLTVSADMVIATGSITSASGSISFDNENLSTTGTLASGTHTIGTLILAAGSITDSSGSIDFSNENLATTGTFSAGTITGTQLNVDNLRLDGNTLSATNTNGNLTLAANGAGVVDITSALTTIAFTTTGNGLINGRLTVDNLRLDGNVISSIDTDGSIDLSPNGTGWVSSSARFLPTTNGTLDLGATSARWQNIYLSGSFGDGTDTMTITNLLTFRAVGSPSTGDTLFWDGSKWVASNPDTEIDHGELTGLADDDHTQYALLAGRSGGQVLKGSTASGENLVLDSTNHATKGSILLRSNMSPESDAAYSGGWTGIDLGSASLHYRHIYLAGEAFGLRLENRNSAPSAGASTAGRVYFNTTTKLLYFDDGTNIRLLNSVKFQSDTSWNGSDTSKSVDVTTPGLDARTAIWVLKDNTNNFRQIYPNIEATDANTISISVSVALPSGSYRLIGLQGSL